ncbi:MAG: branched-chain amino acid ABC transporter permease [Pseudomonadota bacterium]|nr:branched-chain amino acid ABC transporter permease [Pseudomonadota bacterium]
MSGFVVSRASRATWIAGVFFLAAAIAAASAPAWASSDTLRLLIEVFLYVALACLWNFLAGYAGLVSVGQQAYVGLGGYALFALAAKAGVAPLYTLPLIGLGAALISAPIALLLFRLRGAYFAITSWVVAEVFRLGAVLIVPLGGGSGMSLPVQAAKTLGRTPHDRFVAVYVTSLVLLALVLAMIFFTLRSRLGLALTAIRDNELAARANGVNVDRAKLTVYVASAGGTAMIGAVTFLQRLRISPDSGFSVNDWTALVIFMVVIGGIGTFEGPILGALIYFALRETLSQLGPYYLMILGAVAIAIMLFEPRGLWGALRARTGLQFLPLSFIVKRR